MLDGLGPVKQIAKRAKDLGHGAVALTDHGVMYGAIEFFDACNDNGVKPIIGMEGYLTKRGRRMKDRDINFDKSPYHMLMLAMNNTGYKNLMRMSSLAQLEGFYFKPRIDHDLLKECNEGIICTSGCLGSEIPRLIMAGQMDEARAAAKWFRDIFDDRFYFELQEHDLDECRLVNPILVDWAKEMSIPLIVTSDAHYVKREDAIPHDLMLCIQTAASVKQKDRMRFNNDSYYMHTEAEMRAMFDAMAPEAVSTTAVIAERCSVSLKTKNFYLPNFRSPQLFANDDAYLRYLCEIGFEVRYGIPARADGTWVSDDHSLATTIGGMPEALIVQARKLHGVMYTNEETPVKLPKLSPLALASAETNPNMSPRRLRERLDFELNTITTMGFSKYMLIVWDLIRFCRDTGIWWDVRGSAAGSMVSHVLMLTNIEPVSNDLFFERFLNPERVTMPDIDMDFPDDQRHLLVDYTIDKYGKENVAQIITFGTMAARGALKDVGRVMEVPLSDVNRVTSLVPAVPGKPVSLRQAREEVQALKELLDAEPMLREMYEKAITIEGRVRNAGTHAAGVVIADKPLIEYVPLNRLTGTPLTAQLNAVTQFEMGHLEAIGLLKMDYLGLSMLTIIRRAANMIAERHGVNFDMNTIPIHDKAIYDLLSRGDVLGVFQVESAGMKKLMTEMRPIRYENIVAAVSLFRPGPMEYIPAYNRRLHGEEPVTYHHPDLAKVFGETYGICVSGDAMVFDPITGIRCRLDEVQHFNQFHIQGVDNDLSTKVARVTHWISKGRKPVYKVKLRNGASIKITHDHRVLTETGWQPIGDLSVGAYIATPKQLVGPQKQFSYEKLRVLAYLLSDGDIGNLASVNFVSKDAALLDEYKRCLSVFPNIRATEIAQIRNVQRIGVAKQDATEYHAPNTLLEWLRELKLKHPAGAEVGGCRSHEKFVPSFVFELGETEIAFFVASLWDCDGYFGSKLCHYKTISEKLADDVRTLLLRLGIRSVTYTNQYEAIDRKTGQKILRNAYQVTVYDTRRLSDVLKPHLMTQKRWVACNGRDESATLNRAHFVADVTRNTQMSRRQLMTQYGIDRQHFLPKQSARPRIGACVVETIANALALTETQHQLNVNWEEIVSLEPCGEENVYDLTVEGIHNFVADNIIVHNCVYQEQIMSVARDFAGYSMGEADTIRKAVSKKNAEQLAKHKSKFRAGAEKKGYSGDIADAIWADIEFFARYGFNKSHAAIYASITCQTAYLKAKYPTEYLTSLMTAEAGASEKMAALIADAKAHGIDVLPPSVNFSVADFGIQDFKKNQEARGKNQEPRAKNQEARDKKQGAREKKKDQRPKTQKAREKKQGKGPNPAKPAFRFGLTAIKNVGT
ncbi:MAG: DNA polymerase III subunit alpha, partial [Anaerolineae bacterium]|nr:DNA polymerase III subunit alpha [Anaerolineae bacterium]